MARRCPRPELSPEQQAEAERIHSALVAATAADLRLLDEQLATTDRTIFGANEFTIRDIVLTTLSIALSLGWLVDRTAVNSHIAVLEDQCEKQRRVIKQRDLLINALRIDIFNLNGGSDSGPGWATPSRGPKGRAEEIVE